MRLLILLMLLTLPSLSAETFDLPERAARPALFSIDRGGAESDTMHGLGDVSFGGSIGIAFSPLGFLATAEADFWFTSFFSAGPLVQFVGGEKIILGIGGGPKFTFDFGHEWSELAKPYIHFGPGLVLVSGHHDRHHFDRDHHHHGAHVGLLLTLGLGVDFYLWENVSLGTGVLFNWLPLDTGGETGFFAWKVIEAKVHF
jgi:hypothetical protein